MFAFWVYLVSEPDTDEPRYVGLTTDPVSRPAWHRSRPVTSSPRLREWYEGLRKEKKRPKFRILACISGEDEESVTQTARHAERMWIMDKALLARRNLLNIDWNRWAIDRCKVDGRLENSIISSEVALTTPKGVTPSKRGNE